MKNQSEFTQQTESSRIRQRCESICTAFQRRAPVFRSFRANEESLRTFRSSDRIIAKQEFSLRLGPAQIAHLVHEIRVFVCTGPGENEVASRPASGSICCSVLGRPKLADPSQATYSTSTSTTRSGRPTSPTTKTRSQDHCDYCGVPKVGIPRYNCTCRPTYRHHKSRPINF